MIESAIVCFKVSGGETRLRGCVVVLFLISTFVLSVYWETENCVGWRGGIVLGVLAGCPFISCVKQLGLFVVVYNLLVGNGWEILPLEGSLSLTL